MQMLKAEMLLGLCVSLATRMSSNAACDVCPPFWVPFQGSCYRIFGTKLTWTAAEENCKGLFSGDAMSHLVSIRSEAENRFVSHLWESSTGGMADGNNFTYWIGLTDQAEEGHWLWTDRNEAAVYTNWREPREPNNSGGNENCVHLWWRDGNMLTWNDAPCDNIRFYVCELPQRTV